jgi:hypothetical protein
MAPSHLCRVEAVKALNGVLESELVWRREDWRHGELEAKPNDAAKHVPPEVRALKVDIVVELGVGRAPVRSPVCLKAGQDRVRRRRRQWLRRQQPEPRQTAAPFPSNLRSSRTSKQSASASPRAITGATLAVPLAAVFEGPRSITPELTRIHAIARTAGTGLDSPRAMRAL